MEIIGIQAFTVIFCLMMLYLSHISYKRKFYSIYGYIGWSLIFLIIMIASLFPNTLVPFKTFFQLGRLFDLFLVVGILFLMSITYLNFIIVQRLKKKLEKVVQEKSLEEEESQK